MPKPKSKKTQTVKHKTAAVAEAATPTQPKGPRTLPLPQRVWYKPQTWVRDIPAPARTPLPKARLLVTEATQLLVQNWKAFTGIAAIYGVLNLLLVSGLSDPTSLSEFKSLLSGVFTGAIGQLQTASSTFLILLTTSNSTTTEVASVYRSSLLIIASLAIIWALRQATAKSYMRTRDAYYNGMYPLIPFIIILCIIGVQLIPALAGGYLYAVVVSGSIAKDIIEKLVFGGIFAVLAFWSLRMITGSIFALYIVTLPDMTPLKALRSAKLLVYKRRLLIWRKLIVLPVVLLLAAAIIELPLILFLTPLAYWVFFIFSTLAIVFFHSYIYTLYRKLL